MKLKRKEKPFRFLVRREEREKHSLQLRPQDHGHRFAGVVAAEAELEEVAGAAGLGAEHAGRAPDGRQVEVFGLAGSHPDLVPQGVVDHAVALLAAGGGQRFPVSRSGFKQRRCCSELVQSRSLTHTNTHACKDRCAYCEQRLATMSFFRNMVKR